MLVFCHDVKENIKNVISKDALSNNALFRHGSCIYELYIKYCSIQTW